MYNLNSETQIFTDTQQNNLASSYYIGGKHYELSWVCLVRIIVSKRAKENFKIYAPYIVFNRLAPGTNNWEVNEAMSSYKLNYIILY